MAFDHVEYAVRALFRTLRDELPAALAAADAANRALVIGGVGPYEIVAGVNDRLALKGSGASATEVVLTAGAARTGAQLAADVNAGAGVTGLLAAGDAEGRFTVQSTVAPTGTAASRVRVEPASAADAAETLGLTARASDSVVLALAAKPITFLEDRDFGDGDGGRGPYVAVEQVREQVVQPLRTDTFKVTVRLHVIFPGPSQEQAATLKATKRFVAELMKVVQTGDGRAPYNVGGNVYGDAAMICRPTAMQMQTTVWTIGSDAVSLPVGRAHPEFEIEVYDP